MSPENLKYFLNQLKGKGYRPDPYKDPPLRTAPPAEEFREMYRQRITMEPRKPGEPEAVDRRREVAPWLAS